MKIFKLMAIALVEMLGFSACEKDCDHDFIEVDYSKDIVGTWTCMEADYASSLVYTADGKVLCSGVGGGEYWEDINGVFSSKNNNLSISFENGHKFDGRLDMVANKCISIANEDGTLHTYNYCANNLADEVVGMWVWVDSNNGNGTDNMAIQTYKEDGTAIFTAFYEGEGYTVNNESTYRVIGDLLIQHVPNNNPSVMARRLIYKANATAFGDILTAYDPSSDSTLSWLRISQSLDLAGKKYDYIKTFVSNVKGLDKDVEFMGYTFNFAKMDGVKLDKMLKTLLFNVEFPDANTIKYACHYNNEPMSMEAPIVVDGNKMTVKMSTKKAAYRDVDLYTFQDQDNTQMHMYMHSTAFVNFFGNMQVTIMEQMGQLDLNDAAAVKAVFDSIDEAVETINVSFVMTKAAK